MTGWAQSVPRAYDAIPVVVGHRSDYRCSLPDAVQIAREKIEEWDWASDKHGYCHDREPLITLVGAIIDAGLV